MTNTSERVTQPSASAIAAPRPHLPKKREQWGSWWGSDAVRAGRRATLLRRAPLR